MIKKSILYLGIAAAIALGYFTYDHFSNGSGEDIQLLDHVPADAQWIVEYNDHSQLAEDINDQVSTLGLCTIDENYSRFFSAVKKDGFKKALLSISNCDDPRITIILQSDYKPKNPSIQDWNIEKLSRGVWVIQNGGTDLGNSNFAHLISYLKPTKKQRLISRSGESNNTFAIHEINTEKGKTHLYGFVLDASKNWSCSTSEPDHRSFAEFMPSSVSEFQWNTFNAEEGELKDNELKEHVVFEMDDKEFVALKMKVKTEIARTTFQSAYETIATVGNSAWLNSVIPEMKDANYYSLFKDWIICSSSRDDLESYASKVRSGNWLSTKHYSGLKENLGMNINGLSYQKLPEGKWKVEQNVYANSNAYYNVVDIYSEDHVPAQKSIAENRVEETPTVVERLELDGEPFEFVNHYTKAKEWVVQDDEHNLILMTKEREVIFKRKLEGPVIGEFKMVDALGNNKYQIAFNTENHIYLVDRKGRDVENFPVKLPSPASNEMAVVDYENNENYRLLVALDNGQVLNYKINGKKVIGWKYKKTDKAVIYPITHLRLGNKDYLFALNEDYEISLLDRRGTVRHPLKEQPEGLDNFAFEIFKKSDIEGSGIRYQNNGEKIEFVFGKGSS